MKFLHLLIQFLMLCIYQQAWAIIAPGDDWTAMEKIEVCGKLLTKTEARKLNKQTAAIDELEKDYPGFSSFWSNEELSRKAAHSFAIIFGWHFDGEKWQKGNYLNDDNYHSIDLQIKILGAIFSEGYGYKIRSEGYGSKIRDKEEYQKYNLFILTPRKKIFIGQLNYEKILNDERAYKESFRHIQNHIIIRYSIVNRYLLEAERVKLPFNFSDTKYWPKLWPIGDVKNEDVIGRRCLFIMKSGEQIVDTLESVDFGIWSPELGRIEMETVGSGYSEKWIPRNRLLKISSFHQNIYYENNGLSKRTTYSHATYYKISKHADLNSKDIEMIKYEP